jgi:hypothetical protein
MNKKQATPMTLSAEQVIAKIKDLYLDPLGMVFVETFPVSFGEVRWNTGMVQSRYHGDKYFSLGMPAEDFLNSQGVPT